MGCSASRPETLLARFLDDPSSSSPPSTHSSSPARALSLATPLVHHFPLRDGDSHHLVSLTSTTYGSLRLLVQDPSSPECISPGSSPMKAGSVSHGAPEEGDPSPDSVINAWELMDGLEDEDEDDTFVSPNLALAPQAFDESKPLSKAVVVKEKDISLSKKPLWKHLSEEALLAKLGPDVAYSYRRALSSRHLVSGGNKTEKESVEPRKIDALGDLVRPKRAPASGGVDGVVLYFTSLRGIRKTYEDCCTVRMILKGFQVHVDERDVSMHSEFKKELECALGGKMLSLPRVFIRGKYVGGTEEVKEMNEAGDLAKILEGIPAGNCASACTTCGDVRFLPCPNCDGSRKVFDEDEGLMRRCLDCNENGLIRCYGCCL
ncbi:hypothetical protein MLD38_005525 [Melastoma candidum]|uniref:Uncharacterized protein n=2 Tax=Melastoma candidum TaxID=119954 RepID=A0ACB9RJQ0_9MYRT|nr:hypothetical protein MLD38_005522 [Melastoma candidum]KAI4379198.1 hypothetical protein MLD38_005525 [Melastoma candidum]